MTAHYSTLLPEGSAVSADTFGQERTIGPICRYPAYGTAGSPLAPTGTGMVIVDSVHKSFGSVAAVRGVSFELQPGQIAGLLGPNGAGKTTTIRMIAGFLMPDAGRVTIGGHDTADAPAAARARLGYLPEGNPLYPEMRVTEYLDFRGRLFGIPRELRKRAVSWCLERCWLASMAGRRIATLSKGYKQRVGLAAALLHNPKVLVLDEPTNGLDPSQLHETRNLIRELASDRTMLVSTHILPEVERVCHRAIIIAGGKVLADGTPAELTRRSAATYVIQARDSRVGDHERVAKALMNLPHVDRAVDRRPEGPAPSLGWTEWVVTARPGAPDLREQISMTATQLALTVRELRADLPTLERVFMEVLDRAAGTPTEPDPSPRPTEAAA